MRNAPHLHPAPVPHRQRSSSSSRARPLHADRSLAAIAAVMTGVDPDPADVLALAGVRVDAEVLHLATAAALQQMLQLAPLTSKDVTAPAPAARSVPRDAYYLALALAENAAAATGGAPRAGLHGVAFLEAAALVGAMQSRFLAAVCAQITMSAAEPELLAAPTATLSGVLNTGGRLARGIRLMADHSPRTRRDTAQPDWVFAATQITVAGIPGSAVVDAGPSSLPADLGARMAAPVSLDAADGLWPQSVVRDCLRLCAPAVRQWAAALPRHLDRPNDGDLVVTPALELAPFLVSPATAALTGPVAEPAALPLTPGPARPRTTRRDDLLTALRHGGVPGEELGPDTRLPDAVRIPAVHRDAVTLLAAAPAVDLGREVEVTANLSVPGWRDVADVLRQIREQRSLVLDEPVLAWADRDVVAGRTQRVSLRARVRRGVPCRTRAGDTAVLLPAGTELEVLEIDRVDSTRGHATIYADQPQHSPPGARSVALAAAVA